MAQGFTSEEAVGPKSKVDVTSMTGSNKTGAISPDSDLNDSQSSTTSNVEKSHEDTLHTFPWSDGFQRPCIRCCLRPALCAFLCCCISGPIVCLQCEREMRHCPYCGRNNTTV